MIVSPNRFTFHVRIAIASSNPETCMNHGSMEVDVGCGATQMHTLYDSHAMGRDVGPRRLSLEPPGPEWCVVGTADMLTSHMLVVSTWRLCVVGVQARKRKEESDHHHLPIPGQLQRGLSQVCRHWLDTVARRVERVVNT